MATSAVVSDLQGTIVAGSGQTATDSDTSDTAGYDLGSLLVMLDSMGTYRLEAQVILDGTNSRGQKVISNNKIIVVNDSVHGMKQVDLQYGQSEPTAIDQSSSTLITSEGTYVNLPGTGCIVTDSTFADYKPVGLANVDNILSHIYGALFLDESDLPEGDLVRRYAFNQEMSERWANEDVTVNGIMDVSPDSGFLLRAAYNASGTISFIASEPYQGQISVEIDIDPGADVSTITIPSGCLETSLYPLVQDAYTITAIEELVSYWTGFSTEEIVAFYEQAMPLSGWSLVEEPLILETGAFLDFVKDGNEVTITIEDRNGGNARFVLISP